MTPWDPTLLLTDEDEGTDTPPIPLDRLKRGPLVPDYYEPADPILDGIRLILGISPDY